MNILRFKSIIDKIKSEKLRNKFYNIFVYSSLKSGTLPDFAMSAINGVLRKKSVGHRSIPGLPMTYPSGLSWDYANDRAKESAAQFKKEDAQKIIDFCAVIISGDRWSF